MRFVQRQVHASARLHRRAPIVAYCRETETDFVEVCDEEQLLAPASEAHGDVALFVDLGLGPGRQELQHRVANWTFVTGDSIGLDERLQGGERARGWFAAGDRCSGGLRRVGHLAWRGWDGQASGSADLEGQRTDVAGADHLDGGVRKEDGNSLDLDRRLLPSRGRGTPPRARIEEVGPFRLNLPRQTRQPA